MHAAGCSVIARQLFNHFHWFVIRAIRETAVIIPTAMFLRQTMVPQTMAPRTLSTLLALCVRVLKTFVNPAHVMARRVMALVARLTLVWLVLHVFNAKAPTKEANIITRIREVVAASTVTA